MLDEQEKGAAPTPMSTPSFTLGEFIAEAGRAIRQTLPKKAWVEAVVLEAKAHRGGLSLELVDPMADASNNAFLRCFLNANARDAIEAEVGLRLDVPTLRSVHARLLLKPTFHPRYHLEGQVIGLDPAIVESLVAKRTEAIRRTLRTENLWGAQSRLPTPTDITSVAVIHPDRSAGWADVQAELERLQSCGILRLQSHPVPFEGRSAAFGIRQKLIEIEASLATTHTDVILIVRGGGAAAGLAALADLALARAICLCPVPIVSGLGHASDRTLLDEIAWRAADTPSKSLGVVKSILRQRCEEAFDDHRAIVEGLDRRIGQTLQPLLTNAGDALIGVTDMMVSRQSLRLRDLAHAVEKSVITFRGEIAVTQANLDRLADELLATAPQVPSRAVAETRTLYVGIVQATRAMLPNVGILSAEMMRSGRIVTDLLDRQATHLKTVRLDLEATMRRRLGIEDGRLANAAASVEALDAMATLRRGFVLPLDGQRKIIRSAERARSASTFELLFTDGSVACRPVSRT